MKVKAPEMARALAAADPKYSCFFVYGPDEATSRAQADTLAKAMGADAERIDLEGATLKEDPARLSDEANAFSMFASKRWVRVTAGDESLAAIDALLSGTPSGNPVIIISGDLKKTSALVKRLETDPAVLVCQNYMPEAADANRLAISIGRELGLRIESDIARQIAAGCAADQAVMRRELEKFALYLDADPASLQDLTPAVIEALGADSDEGDIGRLVNAVMDGRARDVAAEISLLESDAIRILNQLMTRIVLLARLRGEVDEGADVAVAMERSARGLFWREKPGVTQQVRRWTAQRLATGHSRLLSVRRGVMASSAAADVQVEAELIAIARVAARLR